MIAILSGLTYFHVTMAGEV